MAKTELLYGLNPAFEAVRAGRRTLYEAWVAAGAAPKSRLHRLAERLTERGLPVHGVDKGHLHNLVRHNEHQGVVLACSAYPYVPLESLWQEDRLLLPDNLEDPQNLGAILRSAEVFGVRGVLLPGKGVPEIYPSVVRASTGATEHLRIARGGGVNACAERCRKEGYALAALDMNGKFTLEEFAAQAPRRLVLVIGGEDKSVGQWILNQAEFTVRLPQFGRVGSLNASVAAGIALYRMSVGGIAPESAPLPPTDAADLGENS